jgi:hypothetical protein
VAKMGGSYLKWNFHSIIRRKTISTALLVPVYFQTNETGWAVKKEFDMLTYKKEADPGILLHFQLILITHKSSSYQAFHSFCEEIQVSFPSQLQPKTCSFHYVSP